MMSRTSIPLVCYWDGRISHGPQGVTFEDAIPKATKVNRGIRYSDMIDKIYELIGINCQQYELKIICRYLANGQYIPLQIVSDESVDIMLDLTKDKGINCVELYIEKSVVAGYEGDKPTVTRDPSLYIHLKARTLDGKDILFRMMRDTPLQKLLTALSERQVLGVKEHILIYGGLRLSGEKTPNEYGIGDGDVIHVMANLRGD